MSITEIIAGFHLIDYILLIIIFGYMGYVIYYYHRFEDDQCAGNCKKCGLAHCKNIEGKGLQKYKEENWKH